MAQSLDAVEVSAALEAIWVRVRALNRFVQDRAPWQLAKDDDRADELDQVLYGLAEGLRVVSVLLLPWLPDTAERLLAALGSDDRSLGCARLGDHGGGGTVGELGQLFPRIEPPVEAA